MGSLALGEEEHVSKRGVDWMWKQTSYARGKQEAARDDLTVSRRLVPSFYLPFFTKAKEKVSVKEVIIGDIS